MSLSNFGRWIRGIVEYSFDDGSGPGKRKVHCFFMNIWLYDLATGKGPWIGRAEAKTGQRL